MNKIYCSILFLLAIICSVDGQNSQYEEILASKSTQSAENYYKALLKFQNEYPLWPNVYFKLGNAQLEIFKQLDPLVDRSSSRQYIANVKTNYSLAKNYVDEKEITRNYEWYEMPKIKNKDSLVILVKNKVDQNYANSIVYADNYEKLVHHYDLAVKNYLEAREIFIDINTRAENLRELFLTADESLKNEVKTCGERFDSTLYHLDRYRKIYQTMPHYKIRKVNVNLVKIDYYRMNGITPTNFLLDNLELWNYKEWSENFLKLIREEVDGLQVQLSEAYARFKQLSQQTMSGDECVQANINELKLQRLANIVSKYDNQSLLIDLFKYQIAKLEFGNQVVYEKNCNISNQAPSDNLISRKARILQNLFNSYQTADSLCQVMSLSDHGTASFQWFFDRHLGGTSGINQFIANQQEQNADAIKQNMIRIKSLRDQQFYRNSFQPIKLKLVGDTLTNETLVDGQWITLTQRIEIDPSYQIFFIEKSNQNLIAGVKQIEDIFRIIWEEPLPSGQKANFYKILSDSSLIISGQSRGTWLKHLGFLGGKRADLRISETNKLQNIYFNDLLKTYTLIQEISYDSLTNDGKYRLMKLNSAGKVSLRKDISLKGKFINMVSQENAYWFFSCENIPEGSNINVTSFDWQSMQQQIAMSYQYSETLRDPMVIKNDNLTLTVIAELDNPTKMTYSLIDYEGNKIHEKQL